MLKNFTPRFRLGSLLMSASFIALLAGSLAISGCSSHNDDSNSCCASNSLFLQSHLSGVADAGGGNGGTNSGANAGSNPSIAISVPGIGEIPGTGDLPLDVGEILTGFGGGALVDVLDAIQNRDIQALLDALDGPRFRWEDFDRPGSDFDYNDLVVGLDHLKDRIHSR